MSIEIKEIETGFAIRFPYQLKDNFKSVFKSAKWNPDARRWEVGPRSGKRLQQWVALAESAAQELAEAEVAELSASELAEVEAAIANIRSATAQQRAKAQTAASAEQLALARDKLAQAKADLESSKQATLEQINKSTALLEQVCDVDAIHEVHAILKRCKGRVGVKYREPFNNACTVMSEQQEKLHAIGFHSVGLNTLYYLNFNRPDRDDPYNVDMSDILNIVPWSDDD